MALEIKELKRSDLVEANSLIIKAYELANKMDMDEEGHERFEFITSSVELEKRIENGHKIYGAFKREELVGVLERESKPHIKLFFILPREQGQGVGLALANFLFAIEKQRQTNVLTVNSSPIALPFYIRLGFTKDSDLLKRNGIPFYKMSIEL